MRLGASGLRDEAAALLRRHGTTAPRAGGSGVLPDLTAREAEILEGLRLGDTNGQIAARLFLSPKTVEHHVSRVLVKLGVRTRAEAAAVAAAADPRI
jgi:DNA-binding NarL/FixJ family response regulator